MSNPAELDSKKIKQKQIFNFIVTIFCVALGAFSLLYFFSDNEHQNSKKTKLNKSDFISPTQKVDAQTVWLERAQNMLKNEESQVAALQKKVDELKNAQHTTEEAIANKEQEKQVIQQSSEQNYSDREKSNEHQMMVPPQSIVRTEAGIDTDQLELKTNFPQNPKKNPDSYVPAGTFATAVMLGAADAAAGVNSASNPVPMLFRIVVDGTLPNHKHSHLKDCVVTAAVVGDISSERGEIRTERMSCTFANDEIVEQAVEGTIFGADSKNGVRGQPVWRESALLGRAFTAGVLSGVGKGISESYTTTSTSPLGSTQTIPGADVVRNGLANGSSTAMEKLADYNIKRAELYHPVIQLSAGQKVDIVFLKGFYLDGEKHEEGSKSKDDKPELFNQTTTSTGLTLSEAQVQKIKQHEQALGLTQP